MDKGAVHQTFTAALDGLVEQVRQDRSILAAILCGSLSHDTVWAKSDIDLVLITIDDRMAASEGMTLSADGVNVHAQLMARAEFRKLAEGSIRNSFAHSYLTKGRLLYTHDDTIRDLCARLNHIGGRDTQLQLLRAATSVLPPLYKAHKWMITRGDLDYSALWILETATPLARVEIIGARKLADREVLPQALAINPAFFTLIYSDLLNKRKTKALVQGALGAIDDYLASRATTLFAPVLEYLAEAGEARSCTEIERHFTRTFDVHGITTACEYLADQDLIGKASISNRLTKRSNVDVQELAFFSIAP
ncbi:hypothetical protein BH09GEM1_BH09GEM1_46790 [soil metagenome]